MEWSGRLNAAIDYIESNLAEEIDINEAAKIACCSQYHFQRMFFAIIGITPGEYIRQRRLTSAARELAIGNEKVIDIALKYGYKSPNAFTRAFRNMHGINPRKVRSSGVTLSAYNRVSFHIEIKGGDDMDYKIVEKPSYEIVGQCKKFTHDNFFKEAPSFWKEYVCTEEYMELWNLTGGEWGKVTEAPLMSVYLPAEDDSKDSFYDIFCVEKTENMNWKKFRVFQIPAGAYAEFNCTYQTSAKTNKYIYGEWLPSTGYERDPKRPDIAAYFPVPFLSTKGMGVRWWIPVLKK